MIVNFAKSQGDEDEIDALIEKQDYRQYQRDLAQFAKDKRMKTYTAGKF